MSLRSAFDRFGSSERNRTYFVRLVRVRFVDDKRVPFDRFRRSFATRAGTHPTAIDFGTVGKPVGFRLCVIYIVVWT